jgi:hypothetical protein
MSKPHLITDAKKPRRKFDFDQVTKRLTWAMYGTLAATGVVYYASKKGTQAALDEGRVRIQLEIRDEEGETQTYRT